MTHSPATQQYMEKQAGGDLRPGDFVFPPGDGPAEEIAAVEVENDDYGVAALLLVTMVDGGTLRIAVGSSVPVGGGVPVDSDGSVSSAADESTPDSSTSDSSTPAGGDADAPAGPAVVVPPRPETPPTHTGPSAEELALIPEPDGTPEAVVRAAATNHKGKNGVQVLADRLAKGINTKSGSCLRDLSDLAFDLCIVLRDPDHALAVADLLNVLPFDGNLDRWASIERAWRYPVSFAAKPGKPSAPLFTKNCCAPPSPRKKTPSRPGSMPGSGSVR